MCDNKSVYYTAGDEALCLLKESIGSGRLFECDIASNSMSPLLSVGDKAQVGIIDAKTLSLGELIVYEKNGHLHCHRYMYARRGNDKVALVTKADTLTDFDSGTISPEHLIGRVVAIKKLDKVIDMRTPAWRSVNFIIGSVSRAQAVLSKHSRRIHARAAHVVSGSFRFMIRALLKISFLLSSSNTPMRQE